MVSNAQREIDKAIAALTALRGKALQLSENADSALAVRDLMVNFATIGDALGAGLAYEVGIDDEIPGFLEHLDGNFSWVCECAARDREEAALPRRGLGYRATDPEYAR